MIRRRLNQKLIPPPKKRGLWQMCPRCKHPAIMRLSDYAVWCVKPGCESLFWPDFEGTYFRVPVLPAQE